MREYKDRGVSSVKTVDFTVAMYEAWVTKKMDRFLPAGFEKDISVDKEGRKYRYLYDIRQNALFLELCPLNKDEITIDKIKQISSLAGLRTNNPISSSNKYRRTNNRYKLKIDATMSDNNITAEFRKGIDLLLKREDEILRNLVF